MSAERRLDWDGCANVRDLGGLHTADGRVLRTGAVVRGDAPDRLTTAGWTALRAYGIRTIVDLRNADERLAGSDRAEVVHLPLDGREDTAFWDRWASGPQFATPLYYAPHLERFPEHSARVIRAIARARPGGVLFHCVGGRDRAGQIAMLVLALVGVAPADIAADYCLSPGLEEGFLASRGTSAGESIVATLAHVDVEAVLREGGLEDADVDALRARLLA